MQSQTANSIKVHVRSIATGGRWTESWTREQLAYFILVCDVESPRFENAILLEKVPWDSNYYVWDKTLLSKQDFEHIVRHFPQSGPREFHPELCDRVAFSYVDERHVGAIALDSRDNPKDGSLIARLIPRLIQVCRNDLQYVEFDYFFARHLFRSRLDVKKVQRLRESDRQVIKDFKRFDSELAKELKNGRLVGRPMLFFCRDETDETFQPLLVPWYDT